MDPNDYDSDQAAEQAAMAQMMGFTSFGSQAGAARPSKKRRYNPRVDAVLAGSDDDGDEDGGDGDDEWGTGANTLPLMPRNVRAARGGNGDGDEAAAAAQRGAEDGRVTGNAAGVVEDGLTGAGDQSVGRGGPGDGDDDPAPQYIDTSQSPVRTGGDETSETLPVVGGAFTEHRPAGRDSRVGAGDHNSQGKRIWWTDYYDPSSNENPWEALEKARGLEPVGSWLPRGHAGNRAGGGRRG